MSDSKQFIDQIEAGKFNDAKETAFELMRNKTAEVVDMKRVEASTTWMDKQADEDLETDNS
jgi:hypothetical protein